MVDSKKKEGSIATENIADKSSDTITVAADAYQTYNVDKNSYSVFRIGKILPVYEYSPAVVNSLSFSRLLTWMKSKPAVDPVSQTIWIWEPTQSNFHAITEMGDVIISSVKGFPVESRINNIIFEDHLESWIELYSLVPPDDYPLTSVLYIDLLSESPAEGYRYYTIAEEWKESTILKGWRGNVAVNNAGVTAIDAKRDSRARYSSLQMMFEIRDNDSLRSRLGGGFRSVTIQQKGTVGSKIRASHDDARNIPTDISEQAVLDWINNVFNLHKDIHIEISSAANELVVELDVLIDQLFESLIAERG